MAQTLVKNGAGKRRMRTQRIKQRKDAATKLLGALIDDGMKQTEIAEYLGVSQPAVSNNLHGVTTVSVASLNCLVSLARSRNVHLPEMLIWREL